MKSRKKNNEQLCCPGLEKYLNPVFFKSLGDPNRIKLFIELARKKRPCTVTELSGCCTIDYSVVSRHLSALQGAGVVNSDKQGKKVYYTARIADLVTMLRSLADSLEESIRISCDESCEKQEK